MAVVALLGLLAMGLLNAYVVYSTRAQIYEDVSSAPRSRVAIVFGASVHRDGTLAPVTSDRVETAVALYRAGRVAKLLISGDHGTWDYDEVNPMRRRALQGGVPPEDIFMDHAGFSTYDTVARAKRVFGVESAILVTQRFHLPRALMIARRFGIEAVGVAADRRRLQSMPYLMFRESLARVKDLGKCLLGSDPACLGPEIPLTADGRLTLDRGRAQETIR